MLRFPDGHPFFIYRFQTNKKMFHQFPPANNRYVVFQFYSWLKFCFLLFLGMEMYDNDMIMSLKQNKIKLKPRIKLNRNGYIWLKENLHLLSTCFSTWCFKLGAMGEKDKESKKMKGKSNDKHLKTRHNNWLSLKQLSDGWVGHSKKLYPGNAHAGLNFSFEEFKWWMVDLEVLYLKDCFQLFMVQISFSLNTLSALPASTASAELH